MSPFRNRKRNRRRRAKIAITQAEITADLLYPARPTAASCSPTGSPPA
jgi:hypothetical protein